MSWKLWGKCEAGPHTALFVRTPYIYIAPIKQHATLTGRYMCGKHIRMLQKVV